MASSDLRQALVPARFPLALGFALGTRATGHGRLRSLIMAMVAGVGSLAVLAAGMVVVSMRARATLDTDVGAQALNLAMKGGVLLSVVTPVLIAAAAAGRMSAALRARRLARLQLMGMDHRSLRLLGVGESAPWALGGWAVGASLGVLAGSRITEALRDTAAGLSAADPGLGTMSVLLLLSLAVPALILGGTVVMPRSGRRTVRTARGVDVRRPRLWRLIPLALGVAALMSLRLAGGHGGSVEGTLVLLLGGAACCLCGAVLLAPVLMRLLADGLVRLGSPAALIAGRRLQSQPGALVRVLAALTVALMVICAAQAIVAMLAQNTAYVGIEHDQNVEARAQTYAPDGTDRAALHQRLAPVSGIRKTALWASADTAARGAQNASVGSSPVFVTTCADLAIMVPGVHDCRDDRAAWLSNQKQSRPLSAAQRQAPVLAGDDTGAFHQVATVPVSPDPLIIPEPVDARSASEDVGAQDALFVPEGLLTPAQLARLPRRETLILADPRPDLIAELTPLGFRPSVMVDPGEHDQIAQQIDLVHVLMVVVMALGLGSFLLGTADRVIERRTELARLRLLGTPVRVLRRAHAAEVAGPLVVCCTAAIVLGQLIGSAYLDVGNASTPSFLQVAIPTSHLPPLILSSLLGAAVVVAVTALGLGSRLSPALLHQE